MRTFNALLCGGAMMLVATTATTGAQSLPERPEDVVAIYKQATDSGSCQGPKGKSVSWWKTQFGSAATRNGFDLSQEIYTNARQYCYPDVAADLGRRLGFQIQPPAQIVAPAPTPAAPANWQLVPPPQVPPAPSAAPAPVVSVPPGINPELLGAYQLCLNTNRQPNDQYTPSHVLAMVQAQVTAEKPIQQVLAELMAKCGPTRAPIAINATGGAGGTGGTAQTGPVTTTTSVGVGQQANPLMMQKQDQSQSATAFAAPPPAQPLVAFASPTTLRELFWQNRTGYPIIEGSFGFIYDSCQVKGGTCPTLLHPNTPKNADRIRFFLEMRAGRQLGGIVRFDLGASLMNEGLSPEINKAIGGDGVVLGASALVSYEVLRYALRVPGLRINAGYRYHLMPRASVDEAQHSFVSDFIAIPGVNWWSWIPKVGATVEVTPNPRVDAGAPGSFQNPVYRIGVVIVKDLEF